jgi:hypothetical protein
MTTTLAFEVSLGASMSTSSSCFDWGERGEGERPRTDMANREEATGRGVTYTTSASSLRPSQFLQHPSHLYFALQTNYSVQTQKRTAGLASTLSIDVRWPTRVRMLLMPYLSDVSLTQAL